MWKFTQDVSFEIQGSNIIIWIRTLEWRQEMNVYKKGQILPNAISMTSHNVSDRGSCEFYICFHSPSNRPRGQFSEWSTTHLYWIAELTECSEKITKSALFSHRHTLVKPLIQIAHHNPENIFRFHKVAFIYEGQQSFVF